MYITDAQLSSLRTRPHRTKLWLAVYQPNTILSAQINHSGISKGEREITIDKLSGVSSSVNRNMTCYIGTTAGGRDIGRIRVISATDTVITLAENSFAWIDGWFLTIVAYYEPWAVFPRITLDDDNVPHFYKDYDIAYTNQNQLMEPVICMGPNYAGFLEQFSSGTYEQVWYTSSGSFDPTPGGGLSTYDWAFEGGMPTGSADAVPGYVEYTGSGYYTSRLRIVSTQGVTGTGYRHIMILDRPGTGDNEPVVKWGFRNMTGDRETGSYDVMLWIREDMDLSKISEGSLVVIFSEDWEGGTEVDKVAANAEGRQHIFYCGYITEDSIYWNPVTSRLEFGTMSITGKMTELATFAATLESKVNAMTWNEQRLMTVDRAAINFLRWQSTVLQIADFAQTNDTKQLKFADFERGTLYDSVNNFLLNTLMASAVSDRQGKIWCEVDARVLPTGTSRQVADTMQNVMDISSVDWRSEIVIDRRAETDLAFLEMGGIYYSGPTSTGSIAAYLSGAPGEAPEYWGDVERVQGIVCAGQDDLNRSTGLAWAMRNALYPNVDLPISGDYRLLDIAPQHRLLMTVAESDTFRGIIWTQKAFIPQSVSYDWMADMQALLMDVGITEETGNEVGYEAGTTIVIPEDPPYDEWRIPDWEIEFPPIIPPDPWLPPIPDPDGWEDGDIVACAVAYNSFGSGIDIVRTNNFETLSPTWESIYGNLSGTVSNLKLGKSNPNKAYVLTSHGIYYTADLLTGDPPTWHESLTTADMRSLVGVNALWNGNLAVTMASESYVCATVRYVPGNYNMYFINSVDATAGPASWFSSTVFTNTPYRGSGGGAWFVWVSDYDIMKVACTAGWGTIVSGQYQTVRYFWSDNGPSLGWSSLACPQGAFSNTVFPAFLNPHRVLDGQTFYYSFYKNDERHYRTHSHAAAPTQWNAAAGQNKFAQHFEEALAEAWFSASEQPFFCGDEWGTSDTGICYVNPEDDKIYELQQATASDKWLGYGFGIWPYDHNIQWVSDGRKNDKIYRTNDMWTTYNDISGNFSDFTGVNGYARFIQAVWQRTFG